LSTLASPTQKLNWNALSGPYLLTNIDPLFPEQALPSVLRAPSPPRGGTLKAMITIELYGVPRLRAGRDSLTVEATSLGEALSRLGAICPALDPSVLHDGALRPHYLIAKNGTQFTADPTMPLAAGDVLILLSADAGG
jgi:sulfur-carrier protein